MTDPNTKPCGCGCGRMIVRHPNDSAERWRTRSGYGRYCAAKMRKLKVPPIAPLALGTNHPVITRFLYPKWTSLSVAETPVAHWSSPEAE